MTASQTRALVLLSGGQDSTTCLYWAMRKYGAGQVEAISFHYGQRHAVEIDCARRIAAGAGVPLHEVQIEGLIGSALVEDGDVDAAHPLREDLPASFTPGRNAVFLSVAAGVAYAKGISVLVGGMCQTDYSGYPDCRVAFVEAMTAALSLALDHTVVVETPLMWLTKAETWRLAAELGVVDVIVQETMTDYNGTETMNPWGRGALDNPASRLRAKGYDEAVEKGWIVPA